MTTKYINQNEIGIGKELKHRVRRLYPAYLFVLAGASALYIITFRKIPYDIPAFLLSAQNFFWVAFGWDTPLSGILGHTWYITLDVYLFLLWILVIKYFPKKCLRFASYIGIIIAVSWRVVCNLISDDRTLSYTIPFGQLDSYCIGAFIALHSKESEANKRYIIIDCLVGLLGLIFCMIYAGVTYNLGLLQSYQLFANSSNYTHNPILVNIYLFVGVLSAGLLRLCLSVKKDSFLCKQWIVTLGNWSYELYLFHYPFIWMVGRHIDNRWLVATISLPLTLISAFLWHKIAEERLILK